MNHSFQGSESIGSIITDFPGAGGLFKKHHIDFCCGGDRILADVLQEQQIEKTSFLNQLNEMYTLAHLRLQQETGWRQASCVNLIDHIVQVHHAYLVKELPVIGGFVAKIVRVHGPLHPELIQLQLLFQQMKEELEQHLIAEEEAVFPYIKQWELENSGEAFQRAAAAIEELESDHSKVGNLLKEMRRVTLDYGLPDGACTTYRLTFQQLIELESDLFQHIHLENNILFPRLCPNCLHN